MCVCTLLLLMCVQKVCVYSTLLLLMKLAKPRTKSIRANRNAYYMLIMLMLPKVSEPLLNRLLLY